MTNEEFVRDVYETSYRRLVTQLVGTCGDVSTAEEVVQEAFVRAIAHGAAFSRTDNPEAWLRQVAVNLARSRWRRLKKYAGLMPRLAEPSATPDLSPDHLILMAALEQLPRVQREAIAMHHLADLPVNEIAAALGISSGTVKARLARGRAALAQLLSEGSEVHHD
ncbi:MAG TPA: SigE family RNA polymerase sigma factor [Nocardioides sp.]|jgi:RNA polymerase sigma-70 factor (ECF subfamily)